MSKIRRLLFAAAFGATLLSPAIASATQPTVKISTPFAGTGNIANTKKFNISVSAVSPAKADPIGVKLYQNGSPVATYSEGDMTYGDSWSYPVSVTADGDYTFKAVAMTVDGSSSDTTTVKVDTSAPATPVYKGSTRVGNKITVTFSAPANADVTTIKIYSSTKSSFTADDSTLVGTLTIGPGETKSFTFTVDSSATRYTAVQAFDSAGNGSALVGDPQTNATAAAQTTISSSTSTTNGSTAQNGQVKSDDTNKSNKDSKSSNSDNKSDNKESNKDWIWWVVIVLIVVGLAGAYVRYMRGEDDNSFWPKSKK